MLISAKKAAFLKLKQKVSLNVPKEGKANIMSENVLVYQRAQLEAMMRDPHSEINLECLLDVLEALILDLNIPVLCSIQNIENFLSKFEKIMSGIRELRPKKEDFRFVKDIALGRYGKLAVVQQMGTEQLYAMKMLSKAEIMNNRRSAAVWKDRDIMATSKSTWILQIFSAFQDEHYLYMVMEYMPGGDFHHFIRMHHLSERELKFYVNEIVLAVDAFHSMGYIHRDIKMEKFLVDRRGHLKLSDFKMAVPMDSRGLVKFDNVLGTACFLAPELVKLHTRGQTRCYGKEADWWSVGVVIYWIFVGRTPFSTKLVSDTFENIRNYRKFLRIPPGICVSEEAKDLIFAFLTGRKRRFGVDGIQKIKQHPFFIEHRNFDTVHEVVAPIVPKLSSDIDTSQFKTKDKGSLQTLPKPTTFQGNQLSFVGFTYRQKYRSFEEDRLTQAVLKAKSEIRQLEQKLNRLIEEKENQESNLTNKLKELQLESKNQKMNNDSMISRVNTKCTKLESVQDQMRENLIATENRLDQTMMDLCNAETEICRLKETLRVEKTTEPMLAHKVKELQKNLEKEKIAHQATKSLLANKNNINKLIESTNKKLEQELKLERSSKLKLESKLLELETQNSRVDGELKMTLQKVNDLYLQKETLISEVEEIKDVKMKLAKEREQLMNTLRDTRHELQNLKSLKMERQKPPPIVVQKNPDYVRQPHGERVQKNEVEITHRKNEFGRGRRYREAELKRRGKYEQLQVHLLSEWEKQQQADKEGKPLKRGKMEMTEDDSTLEDWLCLPSKKTTRLCWERKYAVATKKKIVFYNSMEEKHKYIAYMELDMDKILRVQSFMTAEFCCIDDREAPQIFQITYTQPPVRRNFMTHKGHEFVYNFYYSPTTCVHCDKALWHLFKPPRAIKCTNCHITLHKEHIDQREIILLPCTASKQLLRASSEEEQKRWVRWLTTNISKKNTNESSEDYTFFHPPERNTQD